MTGQPEREPLRGELHPVQLLATEPDVLPSATETVRGRRRIGTKPERLHHLLDRARRGVILPAEGEQLAGLVGELEQQVDAARATARRLNYRAQQAESKNTTFERAVSQWDVNERGTYIPHASLRAIGIAAGTDILGSVRHLKHFQRVEQAEARVAELEAENARYEDVVVGDLNEANIGLQRQAARAEATVARVRQTVDAGPVGSCCAHLIRAALNPPAP